MAGPAAEGSILGIKKLGGLLLVLLGCLLIAAAVSAGYTGLSVAGGVLVALGVVLVVLRLTGIGVALTVAAAGLATTPASAPTAPARGALALALAAFTAL